MCISKFADKKLNVTDRVGRAGGRRQMWTSQHSHVVCYPVVGIIVGNAHFCKQHISFLCFDNTLLMIFLGLGTNTTLLWLHYQFWLTEAGLEVSLYLMKNICYFITSDTAWNGPYVSLWSLAWNLPIEGNMCCETDMTCMVEMLMWYVAYDLYRCEGNCALRQVREPDLALIRMNIKCSVRLKNRLVK